MEQDLPYEQILKSVRPRLDSGDFGFIARVNTPWTMIGLEAWLSAQPADLCGAVIVMPSSKRDQAHVPEATQQSLRRFQNVSLYPAEPFTDRTYRHRNMQRLAQLPRAARALKRGNAAGSLRCLSPRYPDTTVLLDLMPLQSIEENGLEFVVLDEGFGGTPTVGWDSEWLTIKGLVRKTLMGRTKPSERFLTRRDGTNAVDHKLAAEYRAVMERHARVTRLELPETPVALLATSYLSEIGRTTLAAEQRACGAAISLLDALGFLILLKQHPRESSDKYLQLSELKAARDIRFLEPQLPAETYMAHLRQNDIVVGHLSNALFTAQVLFELSSYLLPGKDFGCEYNTAAERAYAPVFPRGLPVIYDLERELARKKS